MYFYLFDAFLQDKKYERELARIEARISELGLTGKIERMSILKNIKEVVTEAVKRGADTVVAVGDDSTVSKIISIIAPLTVNLGIIPIGGEQKIAELLGIPSGEKACEILSKRVIKKLDLGKVNDNFFVFSIEIPSGQAVIECDGQYQVQSISLNDTIKICNLDFYQTQCDPQDGYLDVMFLPKNNSWMNFLKRGLANGSLFTFKKARVRCEQECLPLKIDGHATIKTPVTIEVVPRRLKVIVGKERRF